MKKLFLFLFPICTFLFLESCKQDPEPEDGTSSLAENTIKFDGIIYPVIVQANSVNLTAYFFQNKCDGFILTDSDNSFSFSVGAKDANGKGLIEKGKTITFNESSNDISGVGLLPVSDTQVYITKSGSITASNDGIITFSFQVADIGNTLPQKTLIGKIKLEDLQEAGSIDFDGINYPIGFSFPEQGCGFGAGTVSMGTSVFNPQNNSLFSLNISTFSGSLTSPTPLLIKGQTLAFDNLFDITNDYLAAFQFGKRILLITNEGIYFNIGGTVSSNDTDNTLILNLKVRKAEFGVIGTTTTITPIGPEKTLSGVITCQ